MRSSRTRKDVEAFLVAEFPEKDPKTVLEAFHWAFFGGEYQPFDTKRVWKKEVSTLRQHEKSLEADMSEVWHQCLPKTGGTDPADHIVADWVKMGFEDLGEKITFGVRADPGHEGEPSGSFGRVVREALCYRGSLANWRRVAEAAVKGTGPLS